MSDLSFCLFDDQQFEAVCNLLCRTFNTSNAELLSFYQALQLDFHLPAWPPPVVVDRDFFSSQDDSFQAIYDCAPTIASDLPSLLSRGGQNTVMIIAQDPYNNNPSKNVWIGTPYGLHARKCREGFQTRRYFQLIDVLLQQGYQTYLTDFYKVYVQGGKLPRKERQRFAEILTQEIEIIDPIAVITWGGPATHAVSKLKLKTPHYSYPHPSGSARWVWKSLIGDPPDR